MSLRASRLEPRWIRRVARRLARPVVEAWRFRELLRQLVVRNLKVRYQRSALGFAWTLLNPLLTIGVLVTVFGYIVHLPVPAYWAFLTSGYFGWVFVLHTININTFIIAEHAAMAKSVAIPSDVFVLSTVASRMIEFVAEMLLVMIVLAVFHHGGVPPSFALVPLLIVVLLTLTLGLAMPVAALGVFFRDLQHGVPVALTMLLYLSPVFYPAELVPAPLQQIYLLNPIAAVLTLFHATLYEGRLPSLPHLAGSAGASVAICLAGYALFRRQRALFAEIV